MIGELRKKSNREFGANIVNIAQDIRNKREQDRNRNRPKKDFISEHFKLVRHWKEKKR